MHLSSIAITTGLIGSGVLAWSLTAHSLVQNPELDAPLNPLGINRSPYGEVFAMAMQTPIDKYFHAGMGHASHQHAPGVTCTEDEEKHEHDENCDHGSNNAAPAEGNKNLTPNARLLNLITSLNQASKLRTNPKPASAGLKRHLRRETEDKLRFAYQLDPSHYANYNSLHFFLTEPQIGTRPQLTSSAAKLAEETIDYCLKQENDPRPALTAAAACTNILYLMFPDRGSSESPKFTTAQMRQFLGLLDHCLARYDTIAKQWDESKQWNLLSSHRITECEERYQFISKIRADAKKTILILETQPTS